MTRDEQTYGLTRRQTVASAGAAVAGLVIGGRLGVAGLGTPPALASAIALTPEQEEGPYYVDLEKVRMDVVEDRAGVPLVLRITVLDSTTGKPVKGAAVDIWHCDASGVYSDESGLSTGGQAWLRGVQLTDENGLARFATIYPGHYQGRATHIHAKVHIGGKVAGSTYSGGHVSHTGQLFFDDAISTAVYRQPAYAKDTAARVLNLTDHVYAQQGGAKVRARLERRGASIAKGFTATVAFAVDPSATPAAVGGGGGGGAPGAR